MQELLTKVYFKYMFYSVETLKQHFVCSSSCLAWSQCCFSDRCVGPGRHSAVLFTLGGGDQDTACALPSDHRPREVCTRQRLPHHQRFPRQAGEGFWGSSSQGVYGCVLKNSTDFIIKFYTQQRVVTFC